MNTRGGAGPLSRRGWLIAAAAVAVIVAAAAIVIAVAGSGGSGAGRDAASPGRASAAATSPAPSAAPPATSAGPPQNRLGPVLLVPGYGGGTGALGVLAADLRATGRTATVLHLPGSGTGSLTADVAVLNAAATAALRRGAPSVDVIGYSAGGVVALLWARQDDGIAKARRVVTLGSPFHGTELAATAKALVPADCPAACRQLVPGSQLLASADPASTAGLPPWLSLWSTNDLVVVPADSARLAGAINVPVQSVCPGQVISHEQLPTSLVVVTMVLRALTTGALRAPASSVCPRAG